MWRAAVTGQFIKASILKQGFPSELHIRRLFKKYNKNLHKSDIKSQDAVHFLQYYAYR